MDLLECIQRKATKMTQGMERISHKDRLRELGLFSTEKGRLQGDLKAAFQYLKRVYKKEKDRLLSRVCCGRTSGNGFKLKEGRLRLDIRKTFFTIWVVRHWNWLSNDLIDALSLDTFKARLDEAQGNLI